MAPLIASDEMECIINSYLRASVSSALEKIWEDERTAPGDMSIRLYAVRVLPDKTLVDDKFTVKTPLRIEFEFLNYIPDSLLQVSFVFYNLEGVGIFNGRSNPRKSPGHIRETCRIPGDLLNDDTYTVRVVIVKDTNIGVLDECHVIRLDVYDVERDGFMQSMANGLAS